MSNNPPQFQDDDPLSWFDQDSGESSPAQEPSADKSSGLPDSAQFAGDNTSFPAPNWFSNENDISTSTAPDFPSTQKAGSDETLPAEPRRTERKRTGELTTPKAEEVNAESDNAQPDWFAGLDLDQVIEAGGSTPESAGSATATDDFMPDWMLEGELPTFDSTHSLGANAAGAVDDDDIPSWMREMDVAEELTVGETAPESPKTSSSEFGWLDEIDLSSSISEELTRDGQPMAADESAANLPSLSQPSITDSSEIVAADLAHISSGDIDKLLNLSLPAVSDVPEVLDEFGSIPPSKPSSSPTLAGFPSSSNVTSGIRSTPSKKPQDDLDDLFGDDVLGDEVFNRPSTDVLALQNVDLQGAAPAQDELLSSSTGMTGMLSRRNIPAPSAPPASVQPPEEALRDFSPNADVLPEWVADLRPADAPITLNVGDQVIKLREEPIGKLPDQVKQLRERAKEFRVSEVKTVAPLSGPLAGITGAITPVGTSVTPPPASISSMRSPLKDNFTDRVKVLQNMLKMDDEFIEKRRMEESRREELEARESGVLPAPRTRGPIKPDRLLIAALLLVLIIFPFMFRGSAVMPSLDSVAATANTADPRFQQLAQTISSLERDSWVLVAFEYAPTAAAEMDEMARSILIDVMSRGVRPIIVSTNPAGVLRAYTLIDQMGRDTSLRTVLKRTEPFQSRRDYIILRYLPGGVIGLRTLVNALNAPEGAVDRLFATDIEGHLTTLTFDDVRSLRALPAIVLAESADDVRTWMEQFRDSSEGVSLRVVLLSSVGAAAVAQSYAASSERVEGLLIGVRDAVVYKRITGLEGSAAAAARSDERWQSMQLGLIGSSLVIVVGMVLNTLRGLTQRNKNRRTRG